MSCKPHRMSLSARRIPPMRYKSYINKGICKNYNECAKFSNLIFYMIYIYTLLSQKV